VVFARDRRRFHRPELDAISFAESNLGAYG